MILRKVTNETGGARRYKDTKGDNGFSLARHNRRLLLPDDIGRTNAGGGYE